MKLVTILEDKTSKSYDMKTGHIVIGGFFFKTFEDGVVVTSNDLYTTFRLCKLNLPKGYKFVSNSVFERAIS